MVKIKIILLAGGYATRLYPLTLNQPKPLLEIQGKPIIEHILKKIEDIEEIDEVFIVTNNKFNEHFTKWNENFEFPKKITIVNDQTTSNEDRLGSLGDVQFTINQENIDDEVMIIAGDNLFEFSVKEFVDFYKNTNKTAVALYDVQDKELAKLYGVVAIDENNKMIEFEEKPSSPKSTLASTGIYIYPQAALALLKQFVEKNPETDKAGNFLEFLHTQEDVFCFVTEKPWIDIGNKEQLELARKEFKP